MAWYSSLLTETIRIRRGAVLDKWLKETYVEEIELKAMIEDRHDFIEAISGTRSQSKHLVICEEELRIDDVVQVRVGDPWLRIIKLKHFKESWSTEEIWRAYV